MATRMDYYSYSLYQHLFFNHPSSQTNFHSLLSSSIQTTMSYTATFQMKSMNPQSTRYSFALFW